MMKNFREGSNVIWNGKTDSKPGGYWNDKEKVLKSKEVHTIEIMDRQVCKLEGYDCLFDLELFDLVEEPKFKEGSNVIWNGRKDSGDLRFSSAIEKFLESKEVYTISVIGNKYKGYCKLEGDDANVYDLNWLDLVDYEWEPTKGEFLRFSNDKDFKNSVNGAFYSYDKDLLHPYLVNLCGTISNYKFCKQIEPIYRPYTEFNIEWIGKKLYFDGNSDYEWEIVGYQNGGVLLYGGFGYDGESIYSIFSFERLVNDCTLDGKPFGKVIKHE